MATIDCEPLRPLQAGADIWPELACSCQRWMARHDVLVRDAILLLPYAALLPLARAAFASLGGWQPRIETLQTLAASLAPTEHMDEGGLLGDETLDRIRAASTLLRQPWAQQLAQRDRRSFDEVVSWVHQAAQLLCDAAARSPPPQRAAFWLDAQAALPLKGGPAQFETQLLAVALAWAALGRAQTSDTLFQLKPSAWMCLRLGGSDALAESLMSQSEVRTLLVDADPAPAQAFDEFSRQPGFTPPRLWVCQDLESEAQAAAAAVITALNLGQRPVAVATVDRQLVRRVRALLDRQGLSVNDETGWRLSTTPAAATVMALLRAAAKGADADARLDWLKRTSDPTSDTAWIDVLEAHWRGRRGLNAVQLHVATQRWQTMAMRLSPLADGPNATLAQWLKHLGTAMNISELPSAKDKHLSASAVLRALRMFDLEPQWLKSSQDISLDLSGFTDWVSATLELSNFEPVSPTDPDVVLTPISRAMGRRFAHVVVPGADAKSLGPVPPTPSIIPLAMAERLGIDTAAETNHRRILALAHLLCGPALTITRRRTDAGEPLAPSPLVQWLCAAVNAVHGPGTCEERPWQANTIKVSHQPIDRPTPRCASLPARLSATQVEALRACPYRFFARTVLHLDTDEELDVPVSKRDYGTWLHAVLHHFHRQRDPLGNDPQGLDAAAQSVTAEAALHAASLLPFQASFDALKRPYLAWLADRESNGWRWLDGETKRESHPPAWAPQFMHGRLDRLDAGPGGALELIDYKTTATQDLSKRVKTPLEDTQLIFYAALLRDEVPAGGKLSAMYLSLDDKDVPKAIGHSDAMASVDAMLEGLGQDLQAIRDSAAMPALGEGNVCNTCEMRGLCRKDHWQPQALGNSANMTEGGL